MRSIYFTASKPDGEYTIAYTYSVQANTQTQANAALENIKVGNTTYSVPPSPMVVWGTSDGSTFTPNEGEPSWDEAKAHMIGGGLLYMAQDIGDTPVLALATAAAPSTIASGGMLVWSSSDGEHNPNR